MQTIVIGHRNPDMDSICSAIAYAELKQKLGFSNVIAGRAGNTNERIDYVLQKFGVPAPEFVSDVAPKVADVMETQVISVPHNSSIYHAMNSIEKKHLRGLPVVNVSSDASLRAGGRVVGGATRGGGSGEARHGGSRNARHDAGQCDRVARCGGVHADRFILLRTH